MRRLWSILAAHWTGSDLRVLALVLVAVVATATHEYYGRPFAYPPLRQGDAAWQRELYQRAASVSARNPEALAWVARVPAASPHRLTLEAYVWWSGMCLLLYGAVPLGFAALLVRGRLDQVAWLGLSPRGFLAHLPIYGAFFVAVLPVVVFASTTQPFQRTYPFCLLSHLDLGSWLGFEACNVAHFVAIEIFFRGYLLFTLEPYLGRRAIVVALIPYAMIHFGKPYAEVLGALVTGIVLGEMALRTRSIWGGIVIHAVVGVLMDALALAHVGSLARILSGE